MGEKLDALLCSIESEVARWKLFSKEVLKIPEEVDETVNVIPKASRAAISGQKLRQTSNAAVAETVKPQKPRRENKELRLWADLQREKREKRALLEELSQLKQKLLQVSREKAYWKDQLAHSASRRRKPLAKPLAATKSNLETKDLQKLKRQLADREEIIKRQAYLLEQLAAQCTYLADLERDLYSSAEGSKKRDKINPEPPSQDFSTITAKSERDPLHYLQKFLQNIDSKPDWLVQTHMKPQTRLKVELQRLKRYDLDPLIRASALYPCDVATVDGQQADPLFEAGFSIGAHLERQGE